MIYFYGKENIKMAEEIKTARPGEDPEDIEKKAGIPKDGEISDDDANEVAGGDFTMQGPQRPPGRPFA